MDDSEKSSGSHSPPSAGGDSVPAMHVPLSNLAFQEDEMLSWLQYPLEDSFDKNYCSQELAAEAPASHANFVQDAFSNLTLKGGENLRSLGLRPQSSLPSDLQMREREGAGSAHMAYRSWEVAEGYNTGRGERVLAASTAMAIGAHRAAGLLFQSGAETFNRVRTNAEPQVARRVHAGLHTLERCGSASYFIPRSTKAGDEEHGLKPSVHRLASPNFPLFSRCVSGLQQPKLGFCAQGESGDSSAFKGEPKASVASPTLHAHPILSNCRETSSQAFGAQVTPHMSSTRTHIVNFKPGIEAVSITPVEEISRASKTHKCGQGVSPSFSVSTLADLASGSSVVGISDAMPQMETGRPYNKMCDKEKASSAMESAVTTDAEELMHLKLAGHDSEKWQNIQVLASVHASPPGRSEPVAGKEFDSTSCPVITVSGQTSSEVSETVEGGDTRMASPSRAAGDWTENCIKEAAVSAMKRKAHPGEDIEIESKDIKAQGSASGAKKMRVAEIHNLSERKRRNKINVKMKALQDLIPNANKTDKASVLDEAIEYMKLLQSQVQLMSLRSGMGGMPYAQMLMPPGMLRAQLPPPHLNLDVTGGLGFRMVMDVFGQPFSGPHDASGSQMVSPHPAVQEAHGYVCVPGANEASKLLPVQAQQQHMHANMRPNVDIFGAYIGRKEQKVGLPAAGETFSDAMQ